MALAWTSKNKTTLAWARLLAQLVLDIATARFGVPSVQGACSYFDHERTVTLYLSITEIYIYVYEYICIYIQTACIQYHVLFRNKRQATIKYNDFTLMGIIG